MLLFGVVVEFLIIIVFLVVGVVKVVEGNSVSVMQPVSSDGLVMVWYWLFLLNCVESIWNFLVYVVVRFMLEEGDEWLYLVCE